MKKYILTLFSVIFCGLLSEAAYFDSAKISDLKVDRSSGRLLVNMNIDASGLGKKSNRESWLTPVLTDTAADGSVNTVRFPSVMVGGRNRVIQAQRHGITSPVYRGGMIEYSADTEWQQWMESATMILERKECGCCDVDTVTTDFPLLTLDYVPRKFQMPFQYVRPKAETVKTRELKGRAYIDFPVNRTEIYPDYRSNPRELAVIRATIDSVRQDPDVSVSLLTLKGFASPEGPYNNNVRLAKGRTESLKDYVQGLYHFDPSVIATSYEPEDWAGLRQFMLTSGLEHRDEILAIIDGNLAPDQKDAKIKRDFPAQYAYLLKEVYPALRHTDYTINYIIRSYSDPEEILKLVYTRPQNLSLNEFFLAAESLPTGSEEYNYVFETAARMFPDDEAANLNAANAAMQRGAFESAKSYLKKAGDGGETAYARGMMAALQGEYEDALTYFRQAARLKVADAPEAIRQLEEIIEYNNK